MKLGIDYWNVISHYPTEFWCLADAFYDAGHEVHVISAIGKNRIGTVETEVIKYIMRYTAVHEVVFTHPSQSPALKTAKALELGITVFYDDRQDVCDSMNDAGILCFKVPRIGRKSDTESERI